MVDGFVNILKPSGPTSHDMVAYVRRLLGIRRVGHAGTLDPLACGVLVIAVGRATRLISYLERTRIYRGEITFGLTTSTLDSGGEIVAKSPTGLQRQELEELLLNFTGPIYQVPPMVSALKWQGQRLYNLARKGIEIDRKPRRVLIKKLELLSFTPDECHPQALIECISTEGTYVRSLAADIGEALGCGAYLSFLLRTQSGPFSVSSSLTPNEFEIALKHDQISRWLCPPQDALHNLPTVILDEKDSNSFVHGNQILLHQDILSCNKTIAVRVLNRSGVFLGVGNIDLSDLNRLLKPKVVFN